MHFRIDSNTFVRGYLFTRGMKQIYPNLSLIGVNSTLNLLSFDVRLNDRDISIEKSRDTSKDNFVIDG